MKKGNFLSLFFVCFSVLFLDNLSVSAEWEKPKINLINSYRYLLRESHGIYIKRAQAEFSYSRGSDTFSRIKFTPFIEMRNNLSKSRKLEQKETGLELGADVFKWLYLGESLQYARYNLDWANYIWHPRIKYAFEAETRLTLSLPIFDMGDGESISAYLSDEFTYSFRLSEGVRNEVALGLSIPIKSYLEANLGWRHIDRIHDFDSDAIEAAVTLIF